MGFDDLRAGAVGVTPLRAPQGDLTLLATTDSSTQRRHPGCFPLILIDNQYRVGHKLSHECLLGRL